MQRVTRRTSRALGVCACGALLLAAAPHAQNRLPLPLRRASAVRLLYTSDWSGSREVHSVDPARPGSVAQLTFGHEPRCDPLVERCGFGHVTPSPDGRHIAYETESLCDGDAGGGYLYVARVDGRARRRVARLDGCSDLAWAPDSRRLAYVVNAKAPSIYLVGADGSHDRRLGYGADPTWSPDGRSLALLANHELWIVRNEHFHRISTGVDTYAWSPTGKQLAIGTLSHEYPFFSEFAQVATIRPDGTARRLLNDAPVYRYAWSPSGRWLGLGIDRRGQSGELDVVRPDGSGRRRFGDRLAFTGWRWSSDDRFISYDGYSGLTVLDRGNASTKQLGPVLAEQWSRRGHLLAFSTASGISTLDAASGSVDRLASDSTDVLEWAPHDRSIAYVQDTPYESGDLRVAALSGRVRTVVAGSGTAGGAFGSIAWISPAGPLRYRRPEVRELATVTVNQLTARWPIERIAADGDRVVYVACGRVFVWTPETREVVQAEPAASLTPQCSTPTNYLPFDLYDLALTRDRVAFGVRNGNMSQGWALFEEPLADPAALRRVDHDFGVAGCTVANGGLGDLAGAGDVLLFSRWHEPVPDSPDTCGHPTSQQIYRVDANGCPCAPIATSPGPLIPTDVDAARVVAIGTNETEVLDAEGRPLLAVPVHALAAQLSGLHLVVVVQGQLRDYDAVTGTLLHAWPLPDVPSGTPCGSPHPWGCPAIRLELEDASRDLAAYVVDGQVHIMRLADGADVAIGKGTTARFMNAGLVYADGSELHLFLLGALSKA